MRDDTRHGELEEPRRLVLEERLELLAVEHAALAEHALVELVEFLMTIRETSRVILLSRLALNLGLDELVVEVGHVARDRAVRGRRGRLRDDDEARLARHLDWRL